ncbi:alpha/beta hydrolase [Chondromyces apiculatus]|uniref:Putative alpha-dextrin endo-1, 6-alpha-glucosidase n=1 Tax=Chondromyces apiculatus DSM 436 TaxID=1192034 RepID=A0A017SZ81_9BACT|nr:alpha/beta hydrolase-fold protein [Chondromyces apiculatus]EYF02309.1 putative alpha-dextrin endo-1, 6-alpha-glucosidase [Chondromyces apiculatus DSM 436]
MPYPLGALFQLGPFFIPGLRPRHVRVFIPPEARYRDRPPATLFLFDGQNVFDDAPSFAGGWRLHETVGKLSLRRHRRPILVGIDHGYEDRIKELSPWPTRHGPGHADLLIGWICGELAPFLAREIGLALTPEHVAIGGSSMGGLAALHAHFTRPELFGAVLSMSPSLWLGEGRIFQDLTARPRPLTSTIYLDAGGKESSGKMLQAATHLADALQRRGYGPEALRFRADRRGAHNELAWRRRTPGALRFLFANRTR